MAALDLPILIACCKHSEKIILENSISVLIIPVHAYTLLDYMTDKCHKANTKFYVTGLSSISLVTAAVCSGATYVGGEIVSPTLSEPHGVQPFDTQGLYKGLGDDEGKI